jgi:hypothetical protein
MKQFIIFFAGVLLAVSCSHVEKAVKYPNMAADIDPYSVGEVTVSLDQAFSASLKIEQAEVLFYPRENEVALEFSNNAGQYRQFWTQEGRRFFIEALNRYKEDFANQHLITNYNKSRAAYGKAKGRFQWKTIKISATYLSLPYVELGYRFRDNAPYFTVYQISAKEQSGSNKEGIKESPHYSIYFTRAQAEELAKLFDDAFLLESLKDK